MKLKKIVTFLLLTINTCTLALENTSNETTTTNKTVIPIHLIYHPDSLATDNGFCANYLTDLAHKHIAYQLEQPKIIVMNSVIAYAFLIDIYQHFVDQGYQIPTKKVSQALIVNATTFNRAKNWNSVCYRTAFFSSAELYLTVAQGEKFLIAVYNPQDGSFNPEELLNTNHVKKIKLPSQRGSISTEEQTQLIEIIDELYQSITLSVDKRLGTLANNFVHIFNPTISCTLRFFIKGHGRTVDASKLEKETYARICGMPAKNFAQLLTAINTLSTTDLVLWETCMAGGYNAEKVAEFLERTCQNRTFSIAAYPAFDRYCYGGATANSFICQASAEPLQVGLSASYGTIAYLAPTAKKFKLLAKNEKTLLDELVITTNESKEYGLTTASFELIQDYEKEHNCEVISHLACEAAKNNNPVLFVQIFRSFPNRLDPKLFITCLRLLAEHGNLTDVTFLLKNYPNPIDQEQRKSILELAKHNDKSGKTQE